MRPVYENIKIQGGDTSQPLSMAKRLKVVQQYLTQPGRRFLDCGCGSGAYVKALVQQFGIDAHGVEFDNGKVASAHQDALIRDRITHGNIEALEFADCTWDYVMLNEVLEHVPDDRQSVAEAYRVLKPGGILLIFSPNRWFPFESHGVQLKWPRCAVPRWVPFVPYVPVRLGKLVFSYWARNYGQRQLGRMASDAGFTIIDRTFVWQTFENISKHQPWFIAVGKPAMRALCNTLERTPFLRRFGLSQVLACRK
jgi:ubiquinone/menaquinone biosynthesis C-methylase UbiE